MTGLARRLDESLVMRRQWQVPKFDKSFIGNREDNTLGLRPIIAIAPSALRLDQLDATLIAAFLRHLIEVDLGNSTQMRNGRWAAIRSFFAFCNITNRQRSNRSAASRWPRRLVIALWRYLEHGVIPEGAVLKHARTGG